MEILMSLVGMASLMDSSSFKNKRAINLRTVGGAFALQFIFGGFFTLLLESVFESLLMESKA